VRRIRELERENELGASVEKDYHNSSLPPSSDPARTSETMRDFFGFKLSPATVERAAISVQESSSDTSSGSRQPFATPS